MPAVPSLVASQESEIVASPADIPMEYSQEESVSEETAEEETSEESSVETVISEASETADQNASEECLPEFTPVRLTAEGEDCTVTVNAPEEACIPGNAGLVVTEIDPESEAYKEYLAAAKEKLELEEGEELPSYAARLQL